MALCKSRVLLFFFFLCFWFIQGQDSIADEASKREFEVLTGKTFHQLTNHYILRYRADTIVTTKEIQQLSDKIIASGSLRMKADWFYAKARIALSRNNFKEYENVLKNYNLFVINNPGEYPYLAKLKMLDAYFNFFKGTWTKSLSLFEEARLFAEEENDMHTIIVCEKQAAYISTYTGDQEKGINKLKNVFYRLDNSTTHPDEIEKDVPLLKIKTLELICRFHWFNRVSEIDSLTKYATIYKDRIKYVDEPLEYHRMYATNAYTAVSNKNFKKAQQYVHSSKLVDQNLSKYKFTDWAQAEIYYHKKEYKEGIALIEIFGNADSVSQELYPWIKHDFKFLAKSYRKLGDFERSNYYYEHFERSNNSLDEILDSVSLSIRKREVAEFKKELETLQVEKESKDSMLKYLGLIGSFIILVLLILLFRFYKLKNKNEEQFIALVKSIEQKEPDTPEEELKPVKETNTLNKETINTILEGLKKLEEQHYFLKQECSAYTTAKKIKTNTSYLSKVMNLHYQKTFNTYINDLRIKYVLVRLKNDSRFRAYSIQGIAEELGYKSADSFTKYFKQHTGLLPSFYIKKLNEIG